MKRDGKTSKNQGRTLVTALRLHGVPLAVIADGLPINGNLTTYPTGDLGEGLVTPPAGLRAVLGAVRHLR